VLDPFAFVRMVTLTLAAFWSGRAVLRTVRFLNRWSSRLESLGLPRPFLRRQALVVLLRASILDPLNLALLLVLIALWTL